MKTTLRLTRSFRVADLARPYEIVLDEEVVGKLRTRASVVLPLAVRAHTLQIRVSRLLIFPGLVSPPVTFEVESGEGVEFVCHPPKFLQASWPKYLACLRGARDWWIEMERTR